MASGGKKKGKKGDALARRRARKEAARQSNPQAAAKAASVGKAGGADALPFLMAPLDKDATRRFTLALEDAPKATPGQPLTLVELYFCVPEGLYRVAGSKSTRQVYERWAQDMCKTRGQLGVPERVKAPRALMARKLWEARRLFGAGRYGGAVDRALMARLEAPRTPPPHPAEALQLGEGPVLSVEALDARRHRLMPFVHRQPEAQLRSEVRRFGGTAAISVSTEDHESAMSMLAQQTRDWIRQWGTDALRELLLDGVCWYAARGERDVARTFQRLALSEPFEPAAVDFLTDFVRHHFK